MPVAPSILKAVEDELTDFPGAGLADLLEVEGGLYVIKYIQSRWTFQYANSGLLRISQTPALTWGTGTYVAPIVHPLSTALYGRSGIVAQAPDAETWTVFDARKPSAQAAYVNWARAQLIFSNVLLTVHANITNHLLRNAFRERFRIDCVLFRPDQAAELHTDLMNDTWLLVSDWVGRRQATTIYSNRLTDARFTVLVDEDFETTNSMSMPVRVAPRLIEPLTTLRSSNYGVHVERARSDPIGFANAIVNEYQTDGYVHAWIAP